MVLRVRVHGCRMAFQVAGHHRLMTAVAYMPRVRVTLIPVGFSATVIRHLDQPSPLS